MKLGQLIEYNMRNISVAKCAGETIPRPLLKKSKLSISLDQWCKYLVFEKTKSGLELVFLRHFLHKFSRKMFLLGCSIN